MPEKLSLFTLPGKGALSLRTKSNSVQGPLIKKALQEPIPTNYHVIQNVRDLGRVARAIATTGEFGFDCETSSLVWPTGKLYCLSVFSGGQGYLLNFAHPLLPSIRFSDASKVLSQYFTDDDYKKYGFNIKFDAHFVERFFDIQVGYLHSDGYIASWFHETDIPKGQRRLKPLAERYLGIPGETYGELFGRKAWIVMAPKLATRYAIKDAVLHYDLGKFFEEARKEYPPHVKLFEELDMPTLNEDFIVERQGFLVDSNYLLNELSPRLQEVIDSDIEKLYELGMPKTIDPASPQQLAEYLFDVLKLPQVDGRSTDKAVLTALEEIAPDLIDVLEEFRETSKLKTSFVDNLADLIVNHHIHPDIRTTGTATGRGAMSYPNLQNQPIKVGPMIRQSFLAGDSNWMWVSKDLKGQELRIMSVIAGNGPLREVAMKGTIYEEVAATFYNVDSTTLKKGDERRDKGKIAWLAMQFGAQGPKIAKVFECETKFADNFIKSFFHKRFPEIGRYHQNVIAFSKAHGYVASLLGRKRHLHYDKADNWKKQMSLERQAINDPMQATAADQLKLGFLLCNRWLREKQYHTRAVLRIHDEILFRVFIPEWNNNLSWMLDKIMTEAIPMEVPFETTTEIYPVGPDGYSRWAVKEKQQD